MSRTPTFVASSELERWTLKRFTRIDNDLMHVYLLGLPRLSTKTICALNVAFFYKEYCDT